MADEEILDTMQALANEGWCVVLKRLPKELGWIIEGSRSEYDSPSADQSIGEGKWCCEAQSILFDGQYRRSQFRLHDNAVQAVRLIAADCRDETESAIVRAHTGMRHLDEEPTDGNGT